jgi:hypothetical protein
MLYSEIKRATLGHIHRHTLAGSPIAPSYNNQADYLNRIPLLINDALVNIRTLVKPEPVVMQLKHGKDHGDHTRHRLPDDFWQLKTGGVSVIRDGKFQRTNNYRLMGKDYLLTPKDSGSYTVEYYRYPAQLPLSPADDFELEEDLEVIQTATYYAAANLMLHDDEFVYASLYNDYESRLGRISRGVRAEVQPVQDAYCFTAGGWS